MVYLDPSAPDHTPLSRLGQHLRRCLGPIASGDGIHLVLDSTGLSLVGTLDEIFPKWDIRHVRRVLAANEKPVHGVGSSKRDFLAFPEAVRDDMGNALGIIQFGGIPRSAKPWKGLGRGVLELVESHDGHAYRAVCTIRFAEAVYVLHAFRKKSPSGIRTATKDVDLVEQRLKAAQRDHEEHHDKATH